VPLAPEPTDAESAAPPQPRDASADDPLASRVRVRAEGSSEDGARQAVVPPVAPPQAGVPGTVAAAPSPVAAADATVSPRPVAPVTAPSAGDEALGSPRPRPAVATPLPLLASDALRDDLAPLEPARRAARVAAVAAAVALAALGALHLLGLRPGGLTASISAFGLAATALLAAALPLPYAGRAGVLFAVGIFATTAGVLDSGPAAGIAPDGALWGLLRMIAASLLPAALLFRAYYRAYPGARWILAAGFAAALPFLAYACVALASGDFGLRHVSTVIAALCVVASLSGFMGAETTGAASYTALAVLLSLTFDIPARSLEGTSVEAVGLREVVAIGAPALAFATAAALWAVGLFQLMAWRFARDARRIDVRGSVLPEIPRPEPSTPDWSGRD
jgi:hypothetical protein